MVEEQKNLRIPSELVPRCPVCGGPMAMNLRCDSTFVQDAGWYRANERCRAFLPVSYTHLDVYKRQSSCG